MANAQENKTGRFVVDLGSVDISPQVADRIESAIRQAVLGTIAGLDLQHQVTLGLDPGWRGIRIRLPRTGLATLKDPVAR